MASASGGGREGRGVILSHLCRVWHTFCIPMYCIQFRISILKKSKSKQSPPLPPPLCSAPAPTQSLTSPLASLDLALLNIPNVSRCSRILSSSSAVPCSLSSIESSSSAYEVGSMSDSTLEEVRGAGWKDLRTGVQTRRRGGGW